MSRYVLDSFALLSHYQDEPGAVAVRQLLGSRGHTRWVSVVNLGEVYYQLARTRFFADVEAFDRSVRFLPVEVVDVDRQLALEAAAIKARHAIAYADCFAAALARRLDAAVVTGDPEFRQLEADATVRVEWLPHRLPRGR